MNTQVQAKSSRKSGAHGRGWLAWGRRIRRDEVKRTRGNNRRKPFSLGGGCSRARAKQSFSQCQNLMKMTLSERARRSEDVGVGFTSIGVTVEELWPFIH